MSNKKLNYEYLLKDETQREVIQPFVKMVYGKDIQDAEEATKIFLEHNRKFDIGNEFTVFGDLSYVRDEADVNGFGQLERLENYRQSRALFDNYEGGFKSNESKFNMVGDYVEGFLKSPSLYLSLFVGGTGKGAQMAGSRLTQEAIKQYAKEHGKKFVKGGFNAKLRKEMAGIYGKEYAKSQAVKAGATEAGIAAFTDVGSQKTEIDAGIKDDYSLGQTIGVTALSGAVAGGINYPIAKWQSNKANRMSNIIAYRKNKKEIAVQKIKDDVATNKERFSKVQEIKKQLDGEADEAFKEIGERGQELLQRFGVTDLTHAQVRAGVSDNMAYVIEDLINNNKGLAEILTPTYNPKTGEGTRLTHNIFAALDSGDIPMDQFSKQMNDLGIGLEYMRYMWWSTVSEAGKTLGIWGRLSKQINKSVDKVYSEMDDTGKKLFEAELGNLKYGGSLMELEKEAYLASVANSSKSLGSSIRAIDNIRRGLMVSQPKTAIRNAVSVGMRLPIDAGARYVDNLLAMSAMKVNKIRGKDLGAINNVNLGDGDTMFKWLFNNAEAGTITDELLTKIDADSYASRSFYQAYNEVSYRMAKEEGGGIGSKLLTSTQKFTDFVNIMNRTQEHLFRRVAFMSSIERQLGRLGIIGKGKQFKSMSDFVAKGGMEMNAEIWANPRFYGQAGKGDTILTKAIDDAMEFTFQGRTARGKQDTLGTRLRPKTNLMHGYDTLMRHFVKIMSNPGPTALIPFPRFLYNAIKFQIEHSPIGLMDALGSRAYRKLRGRSNDVYDFSDIGKGIAGSTMMVAAWNFRKSEYAGERWDQMKDAAGKLYNIGPIGPNIAPYLFTADFFQRNLEGTREWTDEEFWEVIEKGGDIEDLKNNGMWTRGPRSYKNFRQLSREMAKAGIGTQARVGTLSSFLDDVFVPKTGLKDKNGQIQFVTSFLKAGEPLKGLAGDYLSGFATPFSVATDMLSVWDGAEEIVRETRFGRGIDPVASKFKNRVPNAILNLIGSEKEIPTTDPFGGGLRRKDSQFASQISGLLMEGREHPFKTEMERLGFAYQDAIIWDESPALTYAYKEGFYKLMDTYRDELSGAHYNSLNDAKKAVYMENAISNIRTALRGHMRKRFTSKINHLPLYDAVHDIRNMTPRERTLAEESGAFRKIRELYGIEDEKDLEEQMQNILREEYEQTK